MFENDSKPVTLMDALRNFLPLAIGHLQLAQIPKINLVTEITGTKYPSFGQYNPNTQQITIVIINRNPVDILRTLAHEMVHFKQDINNELEDNSGETGTDIENEANSEAGIIMRNFAQQYPACMQLKPVTLNEAKYHGKEVQLDKPFLTPKGPTKRAVYVKNKNGNIVKVNFGSKSANKRKSKKSTKQISKTNPKFWNNRYK